MRNTDKLKPCPFCGEYNHKIKIRRMGNKGYRVVCGNCGACGPYIAIKDWHDNKMIAQGQAIKAWNTRKSVERIVEMLNQYRRDYTSGLGVFTDELADRVLRNAIEIVKDSGGINK